MAASAYTLVMPEITAVEVVVEIELGTVVSGSTILRPDGTSSILRSDGTSSILRP